MVTEPGADLRLEGRLGSLLVALRLTFAAAESCTGGLIMHRVTNVPGSSAYMMGGFVTYSNEAKLKFGGVRAETLQQYGAVSSQTALEMVRGVQRAFGVSVAVSATGIVGPGGGTPLKPVGLVYIGIAGPGFEAAREFHWSGDRESNKQQTADAALGWLIECLEGRKP